MSASRFLSMTASLGLSGCAFLGIGSPAPVLTATSGFELALAPDLEGSIKPHLYVMRTEVTQRLWTEVMGENPAAHADCGPECPIESVSWLDAVTFAVELSGKEGLEQCYLLYPRGRGNQGPLAGWPTGERCTGYRLPTEGEWSRAARSGLSSPKLYPWGDAPPTCLLAVMDDGTSGPGCGSKTAPVCSRPAGNNPLGLCDLSGNVREWTWNDAPDARPRAERPKAVRGGSWEDGAPDQRIDARMSAPIDHRNPAIGLRLVRSVPR